MPRKRRVKNPIDLHAVNPHGRVDVLVLSFAERFAAAKLPELVPIMKQHEGVIHAAVNEKLGPHVIPVELADAVRPYLPLLAGIAGEVFKRLAQPAAVTPPPVDSSTDERGGKAA